MYFVEILVRGPVLRGRVVFPAEFAGFQGHFPGRAILPGFMQVEVALELLGRAEPGVKVTLAGVEWAKFSRAIGPGEEVVVEVTGAGSGTYEVSVIAGDEAGGRFRMTVTQELRG